MPAETKKMRAELAENQKKKALLSEKDRTKAMIDKAATKAFETATSTRNKRGGLQVSAIDNCQAAAPSGIDVVYGKAVLFYYCNKCNDYGLCQECHDKKQKAEDSLNETAAKRRRGHETRRGVMKDTGTGMCNHSTVKLKTQQDKRYLPCRRKPGMTGTYNTYCRYARNLQCSC